jgi:hypothetical protein
MRDSGRMPGAARRVSLGIAFAALLVCLCAPGASASVVGRLSWQHPVLVDPSAQLATIACPSTSLCVAADRSGNVITSTDPTGGTAAWHVSHVDRNEGCSPQQCSLNTVACPSTSFCAATDSAGYVFTFTDPMAMAETAEWSSAQIGAPYSLTALSCPSSLLCVAVGHSDAITSTSLASGADAWHATLIDTSPCPTGKACFSAGPGPPESQERQLEAISCPSVSLCVAGDRDGHILVSSDPTGGIQAWNAAYVDGETESGLTGLDPQTPIAEISCPSVSLCVAADGTGNIVTSQNPTGGAPTWTVSRATPRIIAAPEPISLVSLDCPSASFCVGVQNTLYEGHEPTEVALTHDPLDGKEWTRGIIDRVGQLNAISCPTSSLCVAVDNKGNVIVGRELPPPTRGQIRTLLRTEITPSGGRSLIGPLLHRGNFSLAFNPPAPGNVRIRWLLSSTRTGSPSNRVKALLIAHGQRHFPEGESEPVTLRLTRVGIALLKHDNHAQLTSESTFTPQGSRPVTAIEQFMLRR